MRDRAVLAYDGGGADSHMDHNEVLKLLGELSDEDKDSVGTMMFDMIHSDGHADEVELIALQSICASTGILLPG